MYSPSDITVYVPYYNAGRTISRCIESLQTQSVTPFEILVINDGSLEPLPELSGIRVIDHPENRGLSAARNTALANCTTKLIAAIDADVLVDNTWLESLLSVLNSNRASGVGGRMDEFYNEGNGNEFRATHMAQHWGDEEIVNPRFLFGANTLFVKEDLIAAGGYDKRLRTNNEDRTVSEALYTLKKNLVYTPQARCKHLRQDSTESILSGYWGWHHTKGLMEGDFDTVEGIIDRIGRVNFGIGNYRYSLDREEGRRNLLYLDLLIPFVFSGKDVLLYCEKNNEPVPDLNLLAKAVDAELSESLLLFLPEFKINSKNPDWFNHYLERFNENLKEFMTLENLKAIDFGKWIEDNTSRVAEERKI